MTATKEPRTQVSSTPRFSSAVHKVAACRMLGMDTGTAATLTAREWRTLVACLHFARREDGTFWPSLDTLGRAAGLNRQEACRARSSLRRTGIIAPTGERRGRAGGGTVVYRFTNWQSNVTSPTAHATSRQDDTLRAVGYIRQSVTTSPTPAIHRDNSPVIGAAPVVTGDNRPLSSMTTVSPCIPSSSEAESEHIIEASTRDDAFTSSRQTAEAEAEAEQAPQVVTVKTQETTVAASPTQHPDVQTPTVQLDDPNVITRQIEDMLTLRDMPNAHRLAVNGVAWQRRHGWRDTRTGTPITSPIMATVRLVESNPGAFNGATPDERTRDLLRSLAASAGIPAQPTATASPDYERPTPAMWAEFRASLR